MKKKYMGVLGFFAASLLFFGCGAGQFSSDAGGPGKILGLSGSGTDNQKVVTFHVIGKGLEPENALSKGEAVLMAERAAVADGYRQLVEKIRGVYVEAFLKSGRGAIDHERIQIHTQSWIRGAEVMEITRGEYGITNARLSLRINFTKNGMIWWPVGIEGDSKPAFSTGAMGNGGST